MCLSVRTPCFDHWVLKLIDYTKLVGFTRFISFISFYLFFTSLKFFFLLVQNLGGSHPTHANDPAPKGTTTLDYKKTKNGEKRKRRQCDLFFFTQRKIETERKTENREENRKRKRTRERVFYGSGGDKYL